jgi:hypothetical protein
MKIAVFGFVAAASLVLAGCSGDTPADTDTPNATPTPTAVAAAPTNTAGPAVGNLDDPLCAAAKVNVDDAAALESKTEELTALMQDPTFLTGEDTTALNEWGKDMLGLTESSKTFYALGIEKTTGDINADFVILGGFVDKYSSALAQAAADAKSTTEFMTSMGTFFSSEELSELATDAPEAAQNVATYLGELCGPIG